MTESDTLRTRITAIIATHWPGNGCQDTSADESPIDHLADAVMSVVSDEYVNSRGMFHEPDRCLGCEECFK